MLWVPSKDSLKWVYKCKGSVLRLFKSLKMKMWETHSKNCGTEEMKPLTEQEWERLCVEAEEY